MNEITIFFKDRKIILSENLEDSDTREINENFSRKYNERIKNQLDAFFKYDGIPEVRFEHEDLNLLLKLFISNFVYIEAAGGLVRNKNNELLVILRFGKPDLPKGKIEQNETPEEAAVREVEEECGISKPVIDEKAEASYHIYFVKNERILKKTYWFRMTYYGDEVLTPQLKEAIVAANWCNSEKIKEYQKKTYPSIMKYFV